MEFYLNQEALYYEKKAARKTANKIGLGILLFLAFEYFISFAFSIFVIIFPQYNYLVKDNIFNYLYSSSITVPGFLLCGIIIIKSQKRKIIDIIDFNRPKRPLIPLVFIGMGVCMVANLVTNLFASFMPFELKMPQIDTPTDPFGIAIYLITTALFPAFSEEFVFRGAVYGSLKKFGKTLAVVVSAVLFSLIHGNLVQIPFAFIVGLALGFVTAESDSIWPAIIIHFINNFMACVMDYIGIFFGEDLQTFAFGIYMLVFIALGLIFTVVYTSKIGYNAFDYPNTPHITRPSKLFTIIAFAPLNIVFYVFTAISVIVLQLFG